MASTPPFTIEWDAHEHEHKRRSSDWYWAVGIIAVAIAITAIILNNIIFAILILVATFALTLFINREPEITHVVINERGITKGKTLYPYKSLESYWLDSEHPHKKIILRSEKLLMPLIIVPLDPDANFEEIHEALSQFIREEFHSLPWVEKVLEYMGF